MPAIFARLWFGRTAEEAAKAIVGTIGAMDFSHEGHVHPIGASIGLTPIRADCGAVDEIIARADAACYVAKAAGRGCALAAPKPNAADKSQTVRYRIAAAS